MCHSAYWASYCCCIHDNDGASIIGNESVPIQLAQCRFTGLAKFQCWNINIFFANKIYGSNFVEQHSETVMVWNYQNADCSLRKKNLLSFVIIFGTLSFPIQRLKAHFRFCFLSEELRDTYLIAYINKQQKKCRKVNKSSVVHVVIKQKNIY